MTTKPRRKLAISLLSGTILSALLSFSPPVQAQQSTEGTTKTALTLNPAFAEFPVGIAVDKVGNKWVSLSVLCQLRRYAPDWQETLRVNLAPSACSSQLGLGAGGVTVDSTGTAYAALVVDDATIRGVYQIEPSGEFMRLPGTGQITSANSLAFDHNNGTLFVSDMDYGAVWRIPRGGAAELWTDHPLMKGISLFGPRLGANGIAVNKDYVIVSVSYPARLVKIPIEGDGSAGPPEIMTSTQALFDAGVLALDDIALDVHGNVYAASPASPPFRVIVRVSADGSQITKLGPTGGFKPPVLSLAFGTGKGERKKIFAATSQSFGGSGCTVEAVDVGVAGMPTP